MANICDNERGGKQSRTQQVVGKRRPVLVAGEISRIGGNTHHNGLDGRNPKDLMVWNVTDDGVKVRDVVAQESVWPRQGAYILSPSHKFTYEMNFWDTDVTVRTATISRDQS